MDREKILEKIKNLKRENNINLPAYKSKKDIMYRDYMQFSKELDVIDKTNPEQVVYSILRTFYSITKSTANKLNATQATLLVDLVNMSLSQPCSKFEPIIMYNDKAYGFFDFSKITLGELIDLEHCYDEHDLISLMSICYRPLIGQPNKRREYAIEEYSGYNNELFANIDLDTVERTMGVFVKSLMDLKNTTLLSMDKKK